MKKTTTSRNRWQESEDVVLNSNLQKCRNLKEAFEKTALKLDRTLVSCMNRYYYLLKTQEPDSQTVNEVINVKKKSKEIVLRFDNFTIIIK